MLLTPEKIKQAIESAHQRHPGKILVAMEIYEAIAQAQYDEDMATKDEKIGVVRLVTEPEILAVQHIP